ncbi:MAG: hypothetical protein RLZZ350_2423 [Verrucomicrobiota bacterium]|jgi:uncharacterized membrane protein required for colicin V production
MDNLPFNMFDLVAVAFLAFGISRGRKNGMSVEMMFMFQWLAIIVGAALAYEPVAQFLFDEAPVSRMSCNVIAYLSCAIVIRIVFGFIRRLLGGKLLGSSLFGGAEYYLGMGAGLVRFVCIMIFALSFLNARLFTDKEVKERFAYQQKWFDSNFFSGLDDLQVTVFRKSLLGGQVKQHLEFLLLKPTHLDERAVQRPGEWKDPTGTAK